MNNNAFGITHYVNKNETYSLWYNSFYEYKRSVAGRSVGRSLVGRRLVAGRSPVGRRSVAGRSPVGRRSVGRSVGRRSVAGRSVGRSVAGRSPVGRRSVF